MTAIWNTRVQGHDLSGDHWAQIDQIQLFPLNIQDALMNALNKQKQHWAIVVSARLRDADAIRYNKLCKETWLGATNLIKLALIELEKILADHQ